jgi:hypothetical protein
MPPCEYTAVTLYWLSTTSPTRQAVPVTTCSVLASGGVVSVLPLCQRELNARTDVFGADDVLAGLELGDLRLDPLV